MADGLNLDWRPLAGAEAMLVAQRAEAALKGGHVDAHRSSIREARLPFYPRRRLYELTDDAHDPPLQAYVFLSPDGDDAPVGLDLTNRADKLAIGS